MTRGSLRRFSLLSALVVAGCNAISGIDRFTFDGGAEGGRGGAASDAGGAAPGSGGDGAGAGGDGSGAGGGGSGSGGDGSGAGGDGSGAGGDGSGAGGDGSGAGGDGAGAGGDGSGAGGGCDGGPCRAPTGVAIKDQTYTVLRGQAMAGTPVMDPCPGGQVILGYRGLLGSLTMTNAAIHGQIQAQCGRLTLSGADPYTVTTTPDGVTPGRGIHGTVPWEMMCPEDHVVVGFSGRAGSYVDYLAIDCAPLLVTGSLGAHRVEVGIVVSPEGVGGDGGTVFLDTRCGENQAANAAYLIDERGVISAFGLGCSTVSLTY